VDEIEQGHLELSTFQFLQRQEESAIPKRLQVILNRPFLFIYSFVVHHYLPLNINC